MARGTQHRKRRPTANAAVAPNTKAKAKTKASAADSWEDQLFFARLRRHAKPVFVLLALVFALTFVFLGVGSGAGGIGDIVQGSDVSTDVLVMGLAVAVGALFVVLAVTRIVNPILCTGIVAACVLLTVVVGAGGINFSSGVASTGSSISSLEKKTSKDPKDAKAWLDLATAQEQKENLEEAIVALTQYTQLRPKDEDRLSELGGLYLRRADEFAQQYVSAQAKASALQPGSAFKPPAGSPLAQALEDPISAGIATSTSTITTDAYSKYIDTQTKAVGVYKQLAELNPKDATNQYRLAQVAQSANNTAEAIVAYTAFLKLAPNDSLAPAAKKALKELKAQTAPTASASTAG